VATLLDFPAVEVQHPTCTSGLLFPGRRHGGKAKPKVATAVARELTESAPRVARLGRRRAPTGRYNGAITGIWPVDATVTLPVTHGQSLC
jgi:hypothetical protein